MQVEPYVERNPYVWTHEYRIGYLGRADVVFRTATPWTKWSDALEWAARSLAPESMAWVEVRAVSQWGVQ